MDESRAGQRVLVTGGSGFVGRSVVREFLRAGARVVVADRLAFPPTEGVTNVVGELTDEHVLDTAMGGELTGVVHLAAITSVLRSAKVPQQTFDLNVAVTQSLLERCRRRGVERFLLASTNAVVGDVGTNTIDETTPLRPLTPYGATKAACEMLLSGYAGAYGLRAAALRFTNIYGPGMAAKDSFVPRLMRAALTGEDVLIYGDGRQVRDLVHVSDVVAGLLAAWQRRYRGTAIIGAGHSVSVLDIVAAARAATGAALPVRHEPAKPGEMPAVIVDIARARAELGYQPKVALAEGLRTVWADFAAPALAG